MRLLILIAALLMFPIAAVAQKDGPVPSITVNGQAEVMVVPDQVVFTLTVDNLKLELNAAREETEADVKKVFALAQSYKVPPQNVQTYYIHVSERYEKDENNKPAVFKGYAVSQTIVILLPDISRFESMFSELLTAGISDVSNVDFRLSKPRQYMDQARTLALKAAREKAVAMASDLGQKVGNPLSITEVGTDISSAYESGSSSNYSNNISSSITDSVPDNKTSVAPGMMSVTARVKVIFAIY
ncbi:MAG TPA: SIMPL domain-containing protein [Pyrinomonadaceae bacterium]|jgi:uncharacterized protein YggE|nr:SIMPL domain-containing protein [Pyrinomonadaceae bacterium]